MGGVYGNGRGKIDTSPILITGTGALGCLFAARIAAAGAPVVLSGNWAEGLEALRQYGVRLVDADGCEHAYPVQVQAGEDDCFKVRYALVLVKSWQTGRAARQLARCLEDDGVALSLQNGLGNYEQLAAILGSERVSLGVTTTGATLLGPGRVRPGGSGKISLSPHPRLAPLAELLAQAGFPVETLPDAQALLWGKLVINAAINPVTALLEVPNGALLENSAARALLAALAEETAAVAAAQGLALPFPDPVQRAEEVARQTAANTSSMLQDIRRGAPTEIDAICGAIVEAGQRLGVPTPVNWTMWELIKGKREMG